VFAREIVQTTAAMFLISVAGVVGTVKILRDRDMLFSTDSDILKYEAVLFSDLYFPWQELCKGVDGELNGTVFSSQSQNLVSSGVQAGGVIYLRSGDGTLDGCFEIVSVNSSSELTVSVLRTDRDGLAIAPPTGGSGISFRVSTFGPQCSEMLFELTRYFGIGPGNPDSDYGVDDIVDTNVLRQASVYAIIASVYATLGSRTGDQGYWKRSLYYKKLFEKAKESCRVSIDIDSDGIAEITKPGDSIKLLRE
jgi:hypothetical protein